jgi:hypothetical protein
VYQDAKAEAADSGNYILTPLATVADVPLTVLGTLCYMPYYNVKYWIDSIKD